jgi:ribosome biogenesis protein UTP30
MESADLAENVMETIRGVVSKIPGKWTNIQSIHIKTSNSTALPVYNALPPHPLEEEMKEAAE